MKGPGLRTNPVPPSKYSKVRDAADRYERFTGHAASYVDEYPDAHIDVAFKVGTCDGILYTTIRDGVEESYIHKFRKKSRPALAVSHDGRTARILGGEFEFTDRGFEDR